MKEKILRAIKSYSSKPYYALKIQAEACHYTVLLNGIPATSFSTRGGFTTEVPLNNFILKSGRQTLSIRLMPFFSGHLLKSPVSFEAEVGLATAGEGRSLGSFTRVAGFVFGPQLKAKSLPAFTTSIPFEGRVPWDYSALLAAATKLLPGPTTDALLRRALTRLRGAIETRAVQQYQSLIVDGIAKESDVLYRTPAEVDRIVEQSSLSDVLEVPPLPAYSTHLFAEGKLVKAIGSAPDKFGNRPVLTYTIEPLSPGGSPRRATEDYLYHLPRGASELKIF